MYDYLVVGAGLYGAVFAQQVKELYNSKVLVIDRRKDIAGNIYSKNVNDIVVHWWGPHLFHTNDKEVYNYLCRFTEFNHYRHIVKARYEDKIYSLPFNMNTYNQMWGCITPEEAKAEIERQIVTIDNPANVEEWCLANIGPDLYQTLVKGYTEKQWRKPCTQIPASIIKRLPLRFTYNDNYFDDKYQGVPLNGYTAMIANILDGIDVKLSNDFSDLSNWRNVAHKLVFTGAIDEFLDYKYGELEYRSLRFEHETLSGDVQGIGQMNYTSADVPYTRIVEHKHFAFKKCHSTVITKEYPDDWQLGKERYYPVYSERNTEIYRKYKLDVDTMPDVLVSGRLGKARYLDMGPTVRLALDEVRSFKP